MQVSLSWLATTTCCGAKFCVCVRNCMCVCLHSCGNKYHYAGEHEYRKMLESDKPDIRVHGTQYLLETLNAHDQLLIVDDVFSSGLNMQAVLTKLRRRLKRNLPEQIRIACLYRSLK